MSKIRIDITNELTKEERRAILRDLFGFSFEKTENDHWVLYDDEGNEFYATQSNCQFDFSTLSGIFSYNAHIATRRGYLTCQNEMRKVLGIK